MRVIIIFIYVISVYTTASARKRGMEDIYCYKWVFSFFTDDFTEFDIEQSDCRWLVLWIMDKTVIQCKTIIHSPHIVCSNRFRPFSWIPVQSYLKKKNHNYYCTLLFLLFYKIYNPHKRDFRVQINDNWWVLWFVWKIIWIYSGQVQAYLFPTECWRISFYSKLKIN